MRWTWDWTPFQNTAHFGDNPVFDWARVGCVILGMLLVMAVLRVLVESTRRDDPMPWTQWARFLSLVFLMPYVTLTEMSVAGTPASPRLFFGVIGLGLGVYGVHGMRTKQRRNPPVI